MKRNHGIFCFKATFYRCFLFILASLVISSCCDVSAQQKPAVIEFLLEESAQQTTSRVYEDPSSGEKVYLAAKPVLNIDDLASANFTIQENPAFPGGEPVVRLKFTSDGARKMETITANNIGKRLAIIVEGKVVSMPRIMTTVKEDTAIITWGGTERRKELEEIADKIQKAIVNRTKEKST